MVRQRMSNHQISQLSAVYYIISYYLLFIGLLINNLLIIIKMKFIISLTLFRQFFYKMKIPVILLKS